MTPGIETSATWTPTPEMLEKSNLAQLIRDLDFSDYDELFRWSVTDPDAFWEEIVRRLRIQLRAPYERVLDLEGNVENPRWLPGARLNIAESCLDPESDATAIVFREENGELERWSHAELARLARRVARGLEEAGYRPGDAIAVDLPMNAESVAIYLGVLYAGCAVVSIADSFAPEEIAVRLRISNAKGIFTEDFIQRGGKTLPLYEKVVAANAPPAIVLSSRNAPEIELREGDRRWEELLSADDRFEPVVGEPDDTINILFSSGTTGEPKAIPWTQLTPLKCAADGHLHQDIRPGDVVAWPTNLGWMMGPWLIFAALLNRASIALYVGAPNAREFLEFTRDAEVTMLGLVPSLAKAWRTNGLLDDLELPALRVMSSTGEASDVDDYRWLMEKTGAPMIEYCGGTEIGGGYVTGTVLHPAVPATFTTPALGLDLVLLDESGDEADEGEVYLLPPSIGLSTRLLNRDHHEVYYQDTPPGPDGKLLRRHGDRMKHFAGGRWRAQGRADDTMNLGGIKTSSAEIERVLNRIPGILETAAVAVPPPGGGPERLIVFAVLEPSSRHEAEELLALGRTAIRSGLNPLFHLDRLEEIDSLPRTASNKVMRRVLRERAASAG